jgi:hypothetical protein
MNHPITDKTINQLRHQGRILLVGTSDQQRVYSMAQLTNDAVHTKINDEAVRLVTIEELCSLTNLLLEQSAGHARGTSRCSPLRAMRSALTRAGRSHKSTQAAR